LTEAYFRRDNHYVPCVYLKRWTFSPNRVWAYRLLVSHENVPVWKPSSIRGVAYHSYLYTRIAAGLESDEIEQWLEREYETPEEEVLQKATSDGQLTPSDWRVLVRFLAAQDVRTPARLVEFLQRWYGSLQTLLEETMQKSVQKLEAMKARGEEIPMGQSPLVEYFPLRITTEIQPGQEFGTIRAETVLGRGLWLFSIKHLLTRTADILHQHRWTILLAPEGVKWFTSDDPVIRLNYQDSEHYDFGGGWGREGTDIFMPLSPRHLLFTQVGKRPPQRGTQLSLDKAKMILRFIAEHAHRFIFADEQDPNVPILRPRTVSSDLLRNETAQWLRWHEEQTVAERNLAGWAEALKEPIG
jgi:hypothetical protein